MPFTCSGAYACIYSHVYACTYMHVYICMYINACTNAHAHAYVYPVSRHIRKSCSKVSNVGVPLHVVKEHARDISENHVVQ